MERLLLVDPKGLNVTVRFLKWSRGKGIRHMLREGITVETLTDEEFEEAKTFGDVKVVAERKARDIAKGDKMNSPDDERRCVHCDSHHASDSCPGVPRREEGREIEAYTLPATVTIDTKTLTQMLYHYNPGCLRQGETVDHVYMTAGEIVIFLKGASA